MKTFIAATLSAVVCAEELTAEFMHFINYVAKYNKSYESVAEFDMRKEIFLKTHAFIEESNSSGKQKHVSGHNKFSDWTDEEFKTILNGRKSQSLPEFVEMKVPQLESTPESVDWRTTGNVTAVKNQGNCGSCWTFSTTGVLESAYSIDTGTLVSMSEQLLMDCARNESNYSCEGGEIYWAY